MTAPLVLSFSGTASVEGRRLSGIAHAFGTMAQLTAGTWHTMLPGAFDKALRHSDTRAFVEHERRLILGRKSAGTLKLKASAEGLHYDIPELPDTTYANDLLESVRRGDVTEMSFSVLPGDYEIGKARDGLPIWSHSSVRELIDISPVTIPAFAGTSALLASIRMEDEPTQSVLVRARHRALKEIS